MVVDRLSLNLLIVLVALCKQIDFVTFRACRIIREYASTPYIGMTQSSH